MERHRPLIRGTVAGSGINYDLGVSLVTCVSCDLVDIDGFTMGSDIRMGGLCERLRRACRLRWGAGGVLDEDRVPIFTSQGVVKALELAGKEGSQPACGGKGS